MSNSTLAVGAKVECRWKGGQHYFPGVIQGLGRLLAAPAPEAPPRKPVAGDVVKLTGGEKIEVSSIDAEGRVYFKGGRGYRSWPDLIKSIVARKGDTSAAAKKARLDAANLAVQRASSPEWSAARSEDLHEFAIWKTATEKEIDELEEVIVKAEDEKPIQRFLQQNPHLLTALLTGEERSGLFCKNANWLS
jgi:hypothetical protein